MGSVTGNVGGNVTGSVGSVSNATTISDRIERSGGPLATYLAQWATMVQTYGAGNAFWRFITGALSQAPTGSGGGSAGTRLIAMPTMLVAEGQVCPKGRLATITLQSGSSLTYGVQLVDSIGNGVPTGGTTLSAKIKDETGTLLSGLTVEEVLASEGRVTVLIDTRVSELADITYATLEVTRDNGDSDITTYPAQLFIER